MNSQDVQEGSYEFFQSVPHVIIYFQIEKTLSNKNLKCRKQCKI